VIQRQTPQIEYLIAGGSFVRPLTSIDVHESASSPGRFHQCGVGAAARPLLFLTLQHPVDKRPKVHLDGVEFTLKYRDRVWKIVDELGTGLVNLDRCNMALLRRGTSTLATLRYIGARSPRLGDLTSALTGIAASAGLRHAPISWV
jgi:hypothetical protein